MKKKNFCVAVLSASAVLALGASFSSFAAWKAVNSEWVYTDNNGNNVTSAWRTDNGESYYLGDDGYMVRNTAGRQRKLLLPEKRRTDGKELLAFPRKSELAGR